MRKSIGFLFPHQLNKSVGTFLAPGNRKQNTAAVMRDTVHNGQQMTANLSDDTEAIKHNFFFAASFTAGAISVWRT